MKQERRNLLNDDRTRFGEFDQIFFRSGFEGGIPLQKDPKRVLESLRVEEEDPLLHHRPRKFRKRKNELSQVSNTAILSLCLVTGLSSGVGSAFANTLDGNPQNKAPLDEPPSKVELDKDVESPQTKVPQTNSSEFTPSNPPLDEPASVVTDQKPNNSKNNQKHIEKGNGESSKQHQKQKTAETKQNEEQANQVKDETKSKQKAEQPAKKEKKPEKEQKKNPVKNKEIEDAASSKQEKQEKVKNNVPPVNPSTSSSENQEQTIEEEAKNTDNDSINESTDVLLPQTEEGGELPETAGNDLNQVALGAGIALAGAVLLKRKREQS
jgi:flagellar biosynthesis GTPase FlhF